jgi:hypothetical protein
MAIRAFNVATLISSILLACTTILWASAFAINPWHYRLSVTSTFHVGVWGGFDGPFLGRLVFFNDKEYGPYRGSIIFLVDSQGNSARPMITREWGDAFGVYYRHFHWLDTDQTLWTLMVSLAYPLVLFAVLPLAWVRAWWQRRPRVAQRGEPSIRQQMRTVIRLYWWMGVVGTAVYVAAAIGICLDRDPTLRPVDRWGPFVFCGVAVAAFVSSIHVANRLATKPRGMLRRARLVGIILATAYFPILTVPGIICVRRVTRYLAAYCESVQTGTEN